MNILYHSVFEADHSLKPFTHLVFLDLDSFDKSEGSRKEFLNLISCFVKFIYVFKFIQICFRYLRGPETINSSI